MLNEDKDLQPLNAFWPIDVTVSGHTNSIKDVHPLNVPFDVLFEPPGILVIFPKFKTRFNWCIQECNISYTFKIWNKYIYL